MLCELIKMAEVKNSEEFLSNTSVMEEENELPSESVDDSDADPTYNSESDIDSEKENIFEVSIRLLEKNDLEPVKCST